MGEGMAEQEGHEGVRLERVLVHFNALACEWRLWARVGASTPARFTELNFIDLSNTSWTATMFHTLGVEDWSVLQALKPFLRAADQAEAFELASQSFGALPNRPLAEVLSRAAQALRDQLKAFGS